MMKKKWILMSAFAVIAILYTALSFIFVTERTGLFWAGLSFFFGSCGIFVRCCRFGVYKERHRLLDKAFVYNFFIYVFADCFSGKYHI